MTNILKPVSEDWQFFNDAARKRADDIANQRFSLNGNNITDVTSEPPPATREIESAERFDYRWPQWTGAVAAVAIAIGVAVVALKPSVPGPAGPAGAAGVTGPAGPAGRDGRDGTGTSTAPIFTEKPPEPAPAAPSTSPAQQNFKRMEKITRFFTVEANDFNVVTGWQYSSSDDDKPHRQYCYVSFNRPGVLLTKVSVTIAAIDSEVPALSGDKVLPYSQEHMMPLTETQYNKAVPLCTWSSR